MLDNIVERSEQVVKARRQVDQAYTGAMTTLRRSPVVVVVGAPKMPPRPSWWEEDEDTLDESTQTLQQMRRG